MIWFGKNVPHRRVARGAEYLDGINPDWFKLVDTEHIDMRSGSRCIAGQVFGSYGNLPVRREARLKAAVQRSKGRHWREGWTFDRMEGRCYELGFMANYSEESRLTDLWIDAVKRRRGHAAMTASDHGSEGAA